MAKHPLIGKTGKRLPCGRPVPQSREFSERGKGRWQEKLNEYVKSHGLKHSDQRMKIIALFEGDRAHYSGTDLVREVQAKFPEMGPATVYRNIRFLCDAGILRETLADPSGQAVYELSDGGHHDHIVCLDCEAIFEFHHAKIEALQEDITEDLAFSEVHHRHVIYAHCDWKQSERR